ncbi:hypothetical protein [Staphylococcus phage VB-SauS-SA2]|nr:hypothetical protein [Staphylococcus phage VB-SauS-SA2]
MNTRQEEAIKYLLENKGYSIYEVNTYEKAIVIKGISNVYRDYEFGVNIPTPVKVDEGKSIIDMIIEKIEKYIKDIDDLVEEFSEEKEFKFKQYANNILIDMFERGIMNGESVGVISQDVGRGQGKTSTIVYLAQRYGLPIIVSGHPFDSVIKGYDKNLEVLTLKSLRGTRHKIVLVDELETKHMQRLMDTGYIVIGIVK